MGQEWEIYHTGRKVVDAPPGLIVIEWALNRSPEPEWIRYFVTAPGQRSGSVDFLTRAPEVLGSKVRFTVPEGDLENAVRWVERTIGEANQAFNTYVMSRRQQEESERQAEEVTRERRLLEARQRLERLNP